MTSSPPERRRAPGMTAEQRRDTIVQAALPLIAERGAAVTTAQIARAAGIGEATIFRVFDDKDAVLDACVVAALDSEHVLQQLRSVSLEQPLAERLVEAVDALDAYFDRMGTVIGALHASGTPHRRSRSIAPAVPLSSSSADSSPDGGRASTPAAGTDRPQQHSEGRAEGGSEGRDAARAATHQAILELIEPDAAQLRLPAGTLTDAFLTLFYGRGRGPRQSVEVPTEQLVDLFLHGALAPGQPR